MKTTAFLNQDSVVVNLLVGDLTEEERARFIEIYHELGATTAISVEDETIVWIGGSYDPNSGTFAPPPSPEPEVIIEEIIPE